MTHLWPIATTALAPFAAFSVVALLHRHDLAASNLTPGAAAFFALGLLYTQLFEHWAHRVPMHRRVPLLGGIRDNHLKHHARFYGEHFQTAAKPELAHAVGRPWMFPLLFFGHYLLVLPILSVELALPFLFGTVVHYVLFEISHWLTHYRDNPVDQVLLRLPVVGLLRRSQIDHHREHHETPDVAFNFNPPFVGDRLAGTMPRPARAIAPPTSPPEVPVAQPDGLPVVGSWMRPVFRYGALALVGVTFVGVAVLAHSRWSAEKVATRQTHEL